MLPPHSVLLDTALPDAENRRTLWFTDPVDVFRADTLADVPALLAAMDEAVAAGRYVAGWLAYEAGYAFETIAPLRPDTGPLGWFGVYDAPRPAEDAQALLAAAGDHRVTDPEFGIDRATYAERIAAIKAAIAEGDVYQINFTAPFRFGFEGDPAGLYRTLRQQQRVPYGALVHTGDRVVCSFSPELFFRRDGRRIWTRPMKGTAGRGSTLDDDQRLADALRADEKSRAENLMIVDLLRNDLSVVCEPGSVRVPALFDVERYQTLLQMTSTVEGRLREGTSYADLFRALFPCGSVTGAPKIRAMQYIHRLETAPRGVYCGTVGYAGPGDEATFNVAIRTIELTEGQGRMGSGSGVVWDSDADAEYDECLLKAAFLTRPPRPFRLIETMRFDGTRLPLWPLHRERLLRSAAYFLFRVDAEAIDAAVHAATTDLTGPHRVRLTLGSDGDAEVNTAPLITASAPWRLCLTGVRVQPGDPFVRHKTTRRDVYKSAFDEARSRGCDEGLLLNAHGRVTEGSRSNVFARFGDRWYTPPLDEGVLGGVQRAHLLATRSDIDERPLTPDDLRRSDALVCTNAVYGWVAAELIGLK